MWKIEKIIKKGDYYYCITHPHHPRETKRGYTLLHRVLMENHLGWLLNPNEVVHHLDGDKKNNCLSNLEVLDSKEHVRLHNYQSGSQMVEITCPVCRTKKILRKGNSVTYCSKNVPPRRKPQKWIGLYRRISHEFFS